MADANYTFYDNFEELVDDDPVTAELLCRKIGDDVEYRLNNMVDDGCKWDVWHRHLIVVYPTLRDYALGLILNNTYYCHILDCNKQRGEEDLIDYIDLEGYGQSAINLIGKRYVVQLSNGKIVTTEDGW